MTKKVCGSSMKTDMLRGVSYAYEYRNAGQLLSQFTVASCA